MPIEPHQSGVDLFTELEILHRGALSVRAFNNKQTGQLMVGIIRALALLNQRTSHCPLCNLRNSLPIETTNDSSRPDK